MDGNQINKRFKVEKYGELHFCVSELLFLQPPKQHSWFFSSVLPKFEVTVETADEVSIGKEEIEVDVCAK